MNTTLASKPVNRQIAVVDLASERAGHVMNVDHDVHSCPKSATGSSLLLRVADGVGLHQKCDMKTPRLIIAAWTAEMRKKHGVSVAQWAAKAKVGRDTIYRALEGRPDKPVTSTSSLARMAAALGEEPPPFVNGDGVSVESLAVIVEEVVRVLAPGEPLDREDVLPVAEALQDVLAALAADPAAAADPAQTRAVVKALTRRLAH